MTDGTVPKEISMLGYDNPGMREEEEEEEEEKKKTEKPPKNVFVKKGTCTTCT